MDNNISQETKIQTKPPIVVVLGHVDHGKTTLLDYIRTTNIALKEAGGITQSIGASVVITKIGKTITFIDTPGHAIFANMRARGANVADIAILVVAAEEGIKPQTKEALTFIREAKIPYIVAATKSDLPTASVEKVRSDLEGQQVMFEGRGGDVPLVPVSGKTGKGVDELLETISLVAEVNNVSGSENSPFEGIVIETSKGKSGPLASIVVRNGILKVGDEIVSDTTSAKVRGIFDWNSKSVKSVSVGYPGQILGFSMLPEVGSHIWKRTEKTISLEKSINKPLAKTGATEGQLSVVFKAGNTGSLEAILANLDPKITVISSGVGEVTEGDVFIAKSSGAHIYSFESKVPSNVLKLAENEGVHIHSFNIVYEIFEKLEEEIDKGVEVVLGKAQIIADFPYEGKRVSGCKVISGTINKNAKLSLVRTEKELGEIKIIPMKKGRADIELARQGEECGIFFAPQLDFKIGDVILSVQRT